MKKFAGFIVALVTMAGCTSTPNYPYYEDYPISICHSGLWYYQYSRFIFIAVTDDEGNTSECGI